MKAWLMAIAALACIGPACAEDKPCKVQAFESTRFTVCVYDPATDALQLAQSDDKGRALRTFDALDRHLGRKSVSVKFAMNAGMFGDDGAAIGLYVEGGKTRHPLNVRTGNGNFYMVPNGVFYAGADGKAQLATRDAFAASQPATIWATQSGPMLVIDGALNSQIAPDGMSKYIRNAVGITPDGKAVFVISEAPVSFGRLARFLRDGLGCRNALYLDGAVSSVWVPGEGRRDKRALLGPMVVVTGRAAYVAQRQ